MVNESFFISQAVQESFLIALRVVFVFSTSFFLLVLACLIRETPPHQASIRNYLIFIQITLFGKDVFMDIFFAPLPLFPIPGGYCIGVICHGALRMIYQVIIIVWLYSMIGISIILCSLFRHQQLLPERHWMKMGKKLAIIFRILIFCAFTIPCGVWAGSVSAHTQKTSFDQKIIALQKEFGIDVTWIQERSDEYVLFQATRGFLQTVIAILALLSFATFGMVVIFAHMLRLLKNQKTQSRQTIRMIRRSIFALFAQLSAPLFIFVIPFGMLSSSMFTGLSFDLCLAAYAVLPFHTVAHNILLLSTTPTYRTLLTNKIRTSFSFCVVLSVHIHSQFSQATQRAH